MAAKYYAVKKGREPGIYRTWEDCKKQVNGFSGPIYKSFVTEEEALDFLGREENKNEGSRIEKEGLIAYVDGSYFGGKEFGCGLVLIFRGEVIAELSEKITDADLALMRNVAGEIKASELAMTYAKDNGYETLIIYHDYEGIARWCQGDWKTNKEGTKAYKKFYEEISKSLKISFVKVKGHSGDRYNELADQLAKKALEID